MCLALCSVTLGTHLVVPAGNVLLHAADSWGRASLTVALVSCLAPENTTRTKGKSTGRWGSALLSCASCRVAEK